MSNLEKRLESNLEQASNSLALSSHGSSYKGSVSDNHVIVEAGFAPKNQAKYNTVNIKAAGITLQEMKIIENRPEIKEIQSNNLGNALLYNTAEVQEQVPQSTDNVLVQASIVKDIEGVFSDSNFIQKAQNKIIDILEERDFLAKETYEDFSFKIENGQIIANKISYHLNDGAKIDIENIFLDINKQVNLDNMITTEVAQNIHDKLYKIFPIFNNSTPILSEIPEKNTNIKDILLSRTYSYNQELAELAVSSLSDFFKHQGQLFKDMLAVICLGIAKGENEPVAPSITHISVGSTPDQGGLAGVLGSTLTIERKEPLKIIHSITQDDLTTAEVEESAAGVYKTEFNAAMFVSDSYRLVHELMHAAANILFLNEANPYFKDGGKAYEDGLINILLNTYKKVEQPAEDLELDTAASIWNKLLNSPALALITSAITPEIQNFEEFFYSNKKSSAAYLAEQAHNKYFADKLVTEITEEDLVSAAKQQIEALNLPPMELEIIEKIGILIFGYDYEDIGREVFATMLELYYEYNNDITVQNFFSPIEEAISENIHQLVESQLIIPHQLECNGDVNTDIFSYCVEEFLMN